MLHFAYWVRACVACWGLCALTAQASTLAEWQQHRSDAVKDASVLRYYSFDQPAENVPNLAGKNAGTLTVVQQEPYFNPDINPNPATQIDLPRWVSGRWPGKASLSFGKADYAVVHAGLYNTGTNAMTVEAWVRTHAEPSDKNLSAIICGVSRHRTKSIFPGRPDYRDGWRLLTTSTRGLELRLERSEADGGVAIIKGGSPLTGHVWHHVAATLDGAEIKLFIDGQNVATQTLSGKVAPMRAPEGEAARNPESNIGGLQMGGVLALNLPVLRFDLDELVIRNRALAETDIARRFVAGTPDTTADKQIEQHRAELSKLALEDSINLKLPIDTRGYFVREASVPLTLSVAATAMLAPGNYRVQWAITDQQDKQVSAGEQNVSIASGQAMDRSWPIVMPRQCDLYTLNVTFATSAGQKITSRSFPVGIRLPDPAQPGSAIRPAYALGAHEATSRHFESLHLGASCERVIYSASWFPTRKADGTVDFSGLEHRLQVLEPLGVDLLFSYEPASYTAATPQEMEAGLKHFEESLRLVVSKFKGRIKYYEMGNEPNASDKHTKPDYYVGLLKIMYHVVKEIDPQAKVAGPCGVGDFNRWTESVLAAGGGQYMDILSFHNYLGDSPIRQWRNEMKIEALRALMRKYIGKELPVWNSESGFWQPARINGRPMTDTELLAAYQGRTGDDDNVPMARVEGIRMVTEHRSATWQVQSTLLDLARGVERYFLLMGPNNYYPMPNASWGAPSEKGLAWAGMACALADAKTISLFPLASDRAAAVDIANSAGKHTVVVFADEPSAIMFAAPGRTSLDGYDMNGNPVSFPAASAGMVTVMAKAEPVYLLDMPAKLAEIQMMRVTRIPPQISPSQNVSGDLVIENLYDKPLKGRLSLEAAHCTFRHNADVELKPHEKKTIPFQITAGNLKRGDQTLRANLISNGTVLASTQAHFVSDGAARPIVHARQTITLDGDDSDWAGVADETADKINQVMIGRPQIGFMDGRAWQGADDLSFRLRTTWDEKGIYFLIRVRDDELKAAPVNQRAQAYLWDCVELFFDGRALAHHEPGMTAGAEQMAIVPEMGDSPKPCYIHFFGASKSALDISCVGKRSADGYVLEGVIRPAAGAPFKLVPGQKIGLSIAVDDAASTDGERKTQMVLHGTASNARDTSLWGRYELQGDNK